MPDDDSVLNMSAGSQDVMCIPGGHRIQLDRAYYCSSCDHYMCYDHARTALLTTEVKCPKGHAVKKAR